MDAASDEDAGHDGYGSPRSVGDGAVRCGPAVTVTRIGTQVVVRLSGEIGERQAAALRAAVDEIAAVALRRVVIDLDDVGSVGGAGVEFIYALHRRWNVRLLNTPDGLRGMLPRQAGAG